MPRIWTIAAGAALLLGGGAQAAPLAFPGAEGFGANAKGGRGGAVCQVTTLADSGSGSFRTCLSGGNRTVVFRVGGTITLSSKINVTSDNITVAGQTAPGGGIQIRGSTSIAGALLRIDGAASDIVIRHLRLRRGPGGTSGSPVEGDSLEIRGQRVIIDHVSAAWANDENVGFGTGSANVTIQHSIIAEGLYRSTNPEGPHSMGTLLYKVNNASLYRNLLAHNQERGPRINGTGITDVVNNVVYNYGTIPTVITSDYGVVSVNYIGNHIKRGMNGPSGSSSIACTVTRNSIGVYPLDNVLFGAVTQPVRESSCRRTTRFAGPSYPTLSGAATFDAVLAGAGAFPRDAADARVTADAKNGTGTRIDNPSQVGGWPTIAGGTPYPDADKDGMDDNWELGKGLRPTDADDRNGDLDGDDYTNLEEFLADRAADLLG